MSTTAIAMTSFDSSHLPLTTKSPAMVGKHTPFCGNNCSFLHHNLVTALLIDGRKAASRIHPCTGDLPSALKVAIDSATSAGWDQNCFIPDPLDQLRCPLLFLACAFGKFAVVQGLLRNDFIAQVLNEHGETALHFAAKHFHVNKGNVSFDREGAFEKVLHCLTEDSPKLLAAQDSRGFTPFHVSANSMKFEGRSYHKKIRFHQFCLKSMIKRLVELEKASIFTRHEARDIIKTPEIHGLDSVLHILARRSENFELLKFARDSLFQGRFPENKNKEGQTVLSLAWSTDPRGAMNTFHFSSDIPSLQEVDFIGEKNQGSTSIGIMLSSIEKVTFFPWFNR
ncbi:uncharacterized protein [Montipora capricornis]|uniref:uncharacterized protein n=1 Tax=Montipora capricornis TaxID=246305 RepID=UPI0035F1ACC0